MTTNQQVLEMHTLIKCGWCGKDNFTKALTEPETSFLKNCQCCNKSCYNHKICAKAYVKQEMKLALLKHKEFIREFGVDMEEIANWKWDV